MARRVCTTVQGDSVCCQAANQGLLGRAITFTTRSGARRCGVCRAIPSTSTNPRKRGRTVFQFRFAPNTACGIVSGCAALSQQGAYQVPTALGAQQPYGYALGQAGQPLPLAPAGGLLQLPPA